MAPLDPPVSRSLGHRDLTVLQQAYEFFNIYMQITGEPFIISNLKTALNLTFLFSFLLMQNDLEKILRVGEFAISKAQPQAVEWSLSVA